jgi:hypothetical protein
LQAAKRFFAVDCVSESDAAHFDASRGFADRVTRRRQWLELGMSV